MVNIFKTSYVKICQSEPTKVLFDGQINTFSDQLNVFLFFMVTVMLPQLRFPGHNFIDATI